MTQGDNEGCRVYCHYTQNCSHYFKLRVDFFLRLKIIKAQSQDVMNTLEAAEI